MFRKYIVPILAGGGIIFSLYMVYRGMRPLPEPPILFEPPASPYIHYVAGEGLIESFNEDTSIGVSFPDLITNVAVHTGDEVQAGQLLFKLDTRQQEADLNKAEKELARAQTNLDDLTNQFSYYQRLNNKQAVSEQEYTRVLFAKKKAADQVNTARAEVNRIKTVIDRAHIRAPYDGVILQSNAHMGEFANINPFDRKSLIIFGSKKYVQIRVQVAEEDAWRVRPNMPALAFVRGNSALKIPLTFCYIEPYIVPKQSLTGSDFERVDTRVLQIIYSFEKQNYPVYIGQLLDVYVKALPSRES